MGKNTKHGGLVAAHQRSVAVLAAMAGKLALARAEARRTKAQLDAFNQDTLKKARRLSRAKELEAERRARLRVKRAARKAKA